MTSDATTLPSRFETPADRYLGCPLPYARALALETVIQAIETVEAKAPRFSMTIDDDPASAESVAGDAFGGNPGILHFDVDKATTQLDLSDGSTIRHFAWSQSFHGWVSETRINGGRHGDCKVVIRSRHPGRPIGIVPDVSSAEGSTAAALLTLRCARVHLEASMKAPQEETGEAQSDFETEAATVAAHADACESDEIVWIVHATPWTRTRAIDVDRPVDLLDEEALSAMGDMPTRLHVSADGNGNCVVIEPLTQFVDAPDPIERLRTLAATTRRTDA